MNKWLWLIPVSGGLWYWWDALRSRELARIAGRRACERAGVQFLDDTVARSRLRLRRNGRGRLLLSRRYAFEFTSDGEHRYPGSVEVFGARAERVEMAAYRADDAVPPPAEGRSPVGGCGGCGAPAEKPKQGNIYRLR